MKHFNLLADIGGTHARFALQNPAGDISTIEVLKTVNYSSLSQALHAYLKQPATIATLDEKKIRAAALAIANPVDGDRVQMTNRDWNFSISAMQREFDFERLLVVNDFKALALALPHLNSTQKIRIGTAGSERPGVIGLLGPGTGLGVSALVPHGDAWLALETEGGHCSFAPNDARELALLQFAWREHAHVSTERLLSGSGMEMSYRALREIDALADLPATLSSAEIIRRGVTYECALCSEVIDLFCRMLGSVAGNLALTVGARGGVYIGGGIVPRLGVRFFESDFRRCFEAKGRFSNYLAQIPTWLITADYPAFIGVSTLLNTPPSNF